MEKQKFNKYRKDILIDLDNNISKTNLNLEMYELTPYFNFELEDLSLFDLVLRLDNDKRRILHIPNCDLYFMPEQIRALNEIRKHDKIIVSAPTSFGKTLILKEYIFLVQPDVVVYIVPTNALAYELEKDFKTNRLFEMYEVFDKNKEQDNNCEKKLLFIGTQEKFLEIRSTLPQINLFVIDEAYKLEESCYEQRGYKLSKTFLESINQENTKVCLLTPNAKLIGFDKYNFNYYFTTFNAVDKLVHKLDINDFYVKLLDCSSKDKTILFCDSPSDIIRIVDLMDLEENNEAKLIKELENEFHPDWSVIKLLKKGILTHHGLMPKYLQNKMINYFLKLEKYNLLIGTNSISEGINTPTKNLFIHPECKISTRKLLIKNTIGRAGRLGKYPIGHIYVTEDIDGIIDEEIEIKIAISNEEQLEEIESSTDNAKVLSFCEKHHIEENFCKYMINKHEVSLSVLGKILTVLSEDCKYPGFPNLPFMAQKVYNLEYPMYECFDDEIRIKGMFNHYYNIDNDQKISLNTFQDRINYFNFIKRKNAENIGKNYNPPSNSSVVEGYIKFIYSTLEYKILPIANVGKDVHDKYPNWTFGKNVVESINLFNQRYYTKIYGMKDFDSLEENKKKIIMSLKEYGINIKTDISLDMINEIDTKLHVRYSTFDIIKAIKELSISSTNYKNSFKELYFKLKPLKFRG